MRDMWLLTREDILMTGESSWITEDKFVEETIMEFKKMMKNTKGLFMIRGGPNSYHYDTSRRKK